MNKSPLTADLELGRNVKLKRYLAGVPFSHARALTSAERRELLHRLLRPIAVSLVVVVLSYCALGYLDRLGAFAVVVLLQALWILAFVSRIFPYFVALRENCVHVYLGKLADIGTGEIVRKHFLKHYPEFTKEVGRSVEVLSVGNSQRLWKVEGYRAKTELTTVVPTFLATLPDVDETTPRNLTTPEILELRSRLRHEHGTYISLPLLIYLGCMLPQGGKPPLSHAILVVDIAASLILLLFTAFRLRKAWPAIRVLRNDLREGTVRNGQLASGLPWVARGEPAAWRSSSLAKHKSLTSVIPMLGGDKPRVRLEAPLLDSPAPTIEAAESEASSSRAHL